MTCSCAPRLAGKFNHLREEVDPDNQMRDITAEDKKVRTACDVMKLDL